VNQRTSKQEQHRLEKSVRADVVDRVCKIEAKQRQEDIRKLVNGRIGYERFNVRHVQQVEARVNQRKRNKIQSQAIQQERVVRIEHYVNERGAIANASNKRTSNNHRRRVQQSRYRRGSRHGRY